MNSALTEYQYDRGPEALDWEVSFSTCVVFDFGNVELKDKKREGSEQCHSLKENSEAFFGKLSLSVV
ncbi:PiggyBac transposable element-derived protein 4 [Plakobranchus ocellatus]|uniref:PiggyBac transposable element-derived protein 4 n=1 Tax=Plakobranchus ocellatus TaxID=259542 RepID=A0AAV3YNR6_9GAST|nr:PiggyBac transposable element-derived protein 4 [Plakobranchus ocellatus]